MAGVTSTGFEAKRLADILEDAAAELALIVDPVSGETLQPEFGSEDPAMQIVQVPLDAVGSAWEASQLVFNQFDPSKATGASLSALVELNGLQRQPATASTVTLIFVGTPGTVIPAGQLVSDEDNVTQWLTTTEVTLDGLGQGYGPATATVTGPISALLDTIGTIVTAVPGWDFVNNPGPATAGRNVETDSELRQRRAQSTMAPAAGPIESIYGNIANIPGVTYVRAYQNNTLAVDSRGIAPKSVAAVVVGGADVDIAMELLARTGVSAGWFGTTTVTLYDSANEPYAVRFSRPTLRPIFVEIQLRILNASTWPGDGIDQMKAAIIAYAQGGAPALGVEDGFSNTGFPPGSPIIISRLYTPVNFIPGHQVVSLEIGFIPAVGTADLPMGWDELGFFAEVNINIVIVP